MKRDDIVAKSNRSQRNRNGNRAATDRLARIIEKQIRGLTDEDVFGLTFSDDRNTRRIADREAHKRAENYALTH